MFERFWEIFQKYPAIIIGAVIGLVLIIWFFTRGGDDAPSGGIVLAATPDADILRVNSEITRAQIAAQSEAASNQATIELARNVNEANIVLARQQNETQIGLANIAAGMLVTQANTAKGIAQIEADTAIKISGKAADTALGINAKNADTALALALNQANVTKAMHDSVVGLERDRMRILSSLEAARIEKTSQWLQISKQEDPFPLITDSRLTPKENPANVPTLPPIVWPREQPPQPPSERK